MNRIQYSAIQADAVKSVYAFSNNLGFVEELKIVASDQVFFLFKYVQEKIYAAFECYRLCIEACYTDFGLADKYFIELTARIGGPDQGEVGIYWVFNELFQRAEKELSPRMMRGLHSYFLALICMSSGYVPKLKSVQLESLSDKERKYGDLDRLLIILTAIPTKYSAVGLRD